MVTLLVSLGLNALEIVDELSFIIDDQHEAINTVLENLKAFCVRKTNEI